MDRPLTDITTAIEGDFDPRGVASMDEGINPHIQAFRVNYEVEGTNQGQAKKMVKQFWTALPGIWNPVQSSSHRSRCGNQDDSYRKSEALL
jgi:hypothetical protein